MERDLTLNNPEATQQWPHDLLIAEPHGFCAGVVRAVDALWELHTKNQAKNPGAKTYCFHEIIHNNHVVRKFEEAGVVFVNSVEEVPEGSALMISAHGASPEIRKQAEDKSLVVVDATCPLVKKIHNEVINFGEIGLTILHIGRANHDETVGVIGEIPLQIRVIESEEDAQNVKVPDPNKVAMTTQTTMSDYDTYERETILKSRFPNLIEPPSEDRCFATKNRQDAVRSLVASGAEVIVLLGSETSENSKHLADVAINAGARAVFVDEASQLSESAFYGAKKVGLSSGASAPEGKFVEIVSWFKQRGTTNTTEIVIPNNEKDMNFAPPKVLDTI